MAKGKKTKTSVSVKKAPSRSGGTRTAGGAVVVVREGVAKKARRVVRRDSSGGAATFQRTMQGMAIGGFATGIIEKSFGTKIPTIPMLGRKGTIAAAIYFLKPKEQFLKNIGLASAAMAGYEFGKEGKVSGTDDDDDDDDDEYEN